MRFLIVLSIFIIVLLLVSCVNTYRIEDRHPAEGYFVPVTEADIHVYDLGPKDAKTPPIVLIHGASASSKDMKLALGDQLAQTHRVIIIDRPGRGYSTRPNSGHELAVQARLIREALQKINVEKPLLAAQSFGGAVALAYALDYQDELSGLVLMAPVSHEWPGGVAWHNTLSGQPIIGMLFRRIIVPFYGRVVAPSGIDANFWPQPAPEDYFDKAGIALLFRPNDFKNNAADIRFLKQQIQKMQDRYGELTVPTEIFVGTHDTTVSPTIHSYTLSRQISDARLTILPRTGHGLHHTASTEIIKGIERLMISTEGQSSVGHGDTQGDEQEATNSQSPD